MGKCARGYESIKGACRRIISSEDLNETQRKSYNRAVIVLVIGIFATLWVLINAWTLITSALIYIVVGLICIFFYFNWHKIRSFQ